MKALTLILALLAIGCTDPGPSVVVDAGGSDSPQVGGGQTMVTVEVLDDGRACLELEAYRWDLVPVDHSGPILGDGMRAPCPGPGALLPVASGEYRVIAWVEGPQPGLAWAPKWGEVTRTIEGAGPVTVTVNVNRF